MAEGGLRRVGREKTQEAQEAEESEDGGRAGPSQTHGLESPCHVAWAFQPMSGRQRIAGRTAEGWPTEHTEHTEGFLTGGNGVIGGRRAEDGGVTADDGLLTLELRRAGTGLRVTT